MKRSIERNELFALGERHDEGLVNKHNRLRLKVNETERMDSIYVHTYTSNDFERKRQNERES